MSWTPWMLTKVPITLSQCNDCSALVVDHAEARANHEAWHKNVLREAYGKGRDDEANDMPTES